MNRNRICAMIAVLSALAVPSALAHIPASESFTISSGFTHMSSAWDHLLVLLAAGILAFKLPDHSGSNFPLSFLLLVMLGALIGIAGVPLPFGDEVIGGTFGALGLLVALRVQGSIPIGALSVNLLALYYGDSHGAGIASFESAHLYLFGILLAAVAILFLGLALRYPRRTKPLLHWGHFGGVTSV